MVLIDLDHFVGTTINAMESLLPVPVAHSTITAIGNKCFVFGGTDAKGTCYHDIRAIDVGLYLSSTDITVGEGASSEYSFKILIIGDAAVGKSAILTRSFPCTIIINNAIMLVFRWLNLIFHLHTAYIQFYFTIILYTVFYSMLTTMQYPFYHVNVQVLR